MLLFILILALLILAFGWVLLRHTCGRQERPEGWEEEYAKQCGEAKVRAYQAGKKWFAGQETEELEIQSDDGFRLSGVMIPHIAPKGTILLFHGWHSSWEMNFMEIIPFLHEQGFQLVLPDQRAQGDSEGRWITFGVRESRDVAAWVAWASERFGVGEPLYLYGVSMGATTVLMSSGQRLPGNVRGIVADCGFRSPADVISRVWQQKTHLPAGPVVWLLDCFTRLFADFSLRERSTTEAVARTAYPVLFIHGAADDFVPPDMTRRAFEACAGPKTLVLVEGAKHSMSYAVNPALIEEKLRTFFASTIA